MVTIAPVIVIKSATELQFTLLNIHIILSPISIAVVCITINNTRNIPQKRSLTLTNRAICYHMVEQGYIHCNMMMNINSIKI